MKRKRKSVVAKSVSVAALAGVAALAFPGVSSAQVSWDRLLNPEPENWLLYGGNLGGWRYSALDQINRDNAGDLEVKYIFTLLGESNTSELGDSEESVILADNGTLYTADGLNRAYAFDVSSGNAAVPLWMYDPVITKSRTERGLALFDDGVFINTNDTRLIRLNADTGEVVWETVATAQPVDPYGTPSPDTQGFTTEPIVVHTAAGNNMVIQGESTGGQQGTISYVVAANADTGELTWRWYSIPFPGEPGHETWEDDWDAWKTGGGGVWSHATFDPNTNLIFHGTGDAFPTFDPAFRPGDNLFTASTIALDADTGDLVWYFQVVPNESWDFDQPGTRMLYPDQSGNLVAGMFSRAGFYYVHDAATGAIENVFGFTDVTWTAGVDDKTGLPIDYDPTTNRQHYAGVTVERGETTGEVCPNPFQTGVALDPPAFDPNTRIAYLQFTEGCLGEIALNTWPNEDEARAEQGLNRIGNPAGAGIGIDAPANPAVYTIAAYNVDTGERVAEFKDPEEVNQGTTGTLATAGGLIIAGTHTGDVQVFDSSNMELLWTFNVGAELNAPFSTWSVDGNQYFGVIAGGNGNGLQQQTAIGVVFGLRD
jgi:alcohol dehydrogenase (cytochrome c)